MLKHVGFYEQKLIFRKKEFKKAMTISRTSNKIWNTSCVKLFVIVTSPNVTTWLDQHEYPIDATLRKLAALFKTEGF